MTGLYSGGNYCWKAEYNDSVDGLSSRHILPWCTVLPSKSCRKPGHPASGERSKVLWQPTKQDGGILLHVNIWEVKRTKYVDLV